LARAFLDVVEEVVKQEASPKINEIAKRRWDVVVIGAGPAGALAARLAASAGLSTLLLEAKTWPRDKVCGGCLNQRSLAVLGQIGLASELRRCGAAPIEEMQLVVGGRATCFTLPQGLAVSRAKLDALLVESAAGAGVEFLPEASAVIEPATDGQQRAVTVNCATGLVRVAARLVIAADGLARSSLRNLPDFATEATADARVGVGAMMAGELPLVPRGRIVMVVARGGYVGLTRVEADRINIAAALDADVLRTSPSVGDAIGSILSAAGIAVPAGLNQAAWRGRPPLTSRPGRVAAERLFVIGDASGYVEPFTGEGIAAAFESALALAPLLVPAAKHWQGSLSEMWEAVHRRAVRERQGASRVLAWTLRRPWTTAAALGVCRAFPPAANYLIGRINRQTARWDGAEVTAR
jgi:flavin-dependent dehydrogenase